ncbi:hypothetical protein [Marinagarivorans cellulosilyticus]|uniref:Uncharacterized protein n=1 Tax=Marinagarivorans cellulosilyticus TaxID=2721545 RepID=A0AAN1WHN0_9GAMM|nr:hypothetical protein [Marinagarivorans cellulosilyticus]BCD97700.1 hypothetical protein MARGE09_P1901 [Marinagarivorans cellulosilyticus]
MSVTILDKADYSFKRSTFLRQFSFPLGLIVGCAICAVWYFKVMYFDEISAESYAQLNYILSSGASNNTTNMIKLALSDNAISMRESRDIYSAIISEEGRLTVPLRFNLDLSVEKSALITTASQTGLKL